MQELLLISSSGETVVYQIIMKILFILVVCWMETAQISALLGWGGSRMF